jgi:hypothetical protein
MRYVPSTAVYCVGIISSKGTGKLVQDVFYGVVLGLHYGINEIFALLGCYAA